MENLDDLIKKLDEAKKIKAENAAKKLEEDAILARELEALKEAEALQINEETIPTKPPAESKTGDFVGGFKLEPHITIPGVEIKKDKEEDVPGLMAKALKNIKAITKKKEKIETPKINRGHIENYILKILPESFEDLSPIKQQKVLEDFRRRIVDLIKSDAKTQYSEDIKNKMQENAGKSFTKLRNLKDAAKNSFTKEKQIKEKEKESIEKLLASEEGEDWARADLDVIIKKVSNQDIIEGLQGEQEVLYIDFTNIIYEKYGDTAEIEEKIENFNNLANDFIDIPYEWGQDVKGKNKIKKGRNKREYDRVYKKYKAARDEVENIIKEKDGEAIALVNMLQLDNKIKMEQLLNTHPQFEKALNELGESAGWKQTLKTIGQAIKGNNSEKGLLLLGGIGARTLARFTPMLIAGGITTAGSLATAVATPVIGGAIGWYRGKWRAQDTINEKGEAARSGSTLTKKERLELAEEGQKTEFQQKLETLRKDPKYLKLKEELIKAESENKIETIKKIRKEIEIMNSEIKRDVIGKTQNVKDLTEKLQDMISNVRNSPRSKYHLRINLLNRRLDYIKNQVENGLVDFGDTRSSLANQHEFINTLNSALETSQYVNTDLVIEEFHQRWKNLVSARDEKINSLQEDFIKTQARTSRNWGAGFALAGYGAKWLLEHTSLYGGDTTETPKNITQSEKGTIEEYYDWVKEKVWSDKKPNTDTLDQELEDKALPKGVTVARDSNGNIVHYFKNGREMSPKEIQEMSGSSTDDKEMAPEQPAQTVTNFKNKGIEFKDGMGGIKGIKALQNQLKAEYPDITKAPQGVQDFINSDPVKKATELGFYTPGESEESALIPKGSQLKFDEQGNLYFKAPGSENWESKFSGKMIDADTKPKIVEQEPKTRTIRNITKPKVLSEEELQNKSVIEERLRDNIDKSKNPRWIKKEGLLDDEHIQEDASPKSVKTESEIDAEKEGGKANTTKAPKPTPEELEVKRQIESNIEAKEKLKGTPFENSTSGLSPEKLLEVNKVYKSNLEYISEGEENASKWNYVKDAPVKNFIGSEAVEGDRIVPYLNKLKDISKTDPDFDVVKGHETVEKYVPRALVKAAQNGNLDKAKLKEN